MTQTTTEPTVWTVPLKPCCGALPGDLCPCGPLVADVAAALNTNPLHLDLRNADDPR